MSKEKQIWEQPGYDFDPPYPASTPVITNYDLIISKNPGELAIFLSDATSNAMVVLEIGSRRKSQSAFDWYTWLTSPAEEEKLNG